MYRRENAIDIAQIVSGKVVESYHASNRTIDFARNSFESVTESTESALKYTSYKESDDVANIFLDNVSIGDPGRDRWIIWKLFHRDVLLVWRHASAIPCLFDRI